VQTNRKISGILWRTFRRLIFGAITFQTQKRINSGSPLLYRSPRRHERELRKRPRRQSARLSRKPSDVHRRVVVVIPTARAVSRMYDQDCRGSWRRRSRKSRRATVWLWVLLISRNSVSSWRTGRRENRWRSSSRRNRPSGCIFQPAFRHNARFLGCPVQHRWRIWRAIHSSCRSRRRRPVEDPSRDRSCGGDIKTRIRLCTFLEPPPLPGC